MIKKQTAFDSLSIEDKLKFLGIYEEAKEYFESFKLPKFKGIDEEAVREAWEYAQQKRLLEEGMKEYIATISGHKHIQKELQTIELDPIGREIIIDKVKLKQNGR